MLVHLYDCDNTGFPNLALLKLSQWHKEKGDEVIWNFPIRKAGINYGSRVFSWSGQPPPGSYITGGWGSDMVLPETIEHTTPDYTGMEFSIGFLSRGCIRKCSFCIVPSKEGDIRPHSVPEEFIRHNKSIFMDNNWLASQRWDKDWGWLYKNRIRCDFNQGLDARLVDEPIARRLVKLKWWKPIRFACDSQNQKDPLKRAVGLLKKYGYRGVPFVYVLIKDIDDAIDRIEFCRSLGCDPFAQPYRDETGKIEPQARRLARWVNHKAIFKSVKWEEYVDKYLK